MSMVLPAATVTALAAALACRLLVPPPPPLSALVRTTPAHAVHADIPAHTTMRRLARRVPDGGLALRLRQAGLSHGRVPEQAVLEHWTAVAVRALLEGLACGAALLTLTGAAAGGLAAGAAGAIAGGARRHATVQRLIDERRGRVRAELYTVNQLLALDVRAGGGVVQALERTTRRADGVLAEELRDVLAAVRAGVPLQDALEQAATVTVEPAAARTYRLLAKASRYGTDLGSGLRALNEDLRAQRSEAVERAATRRRAAMLLPVIGLLAPVMLLFIVAPLPSLLFGTP